MIIKFLKDKKNIVIFLLVILCAIKLSEKEPRFVFWVLGGIFFSGGFDFLINKLLFKRSISPKSAVITGFILSGILDYHQSFFVLIVFSFLAIASKYILRFKGRYIFNPANFSLFLATVFRLPFTWSIESNIYLIIIVGLYLAYSFKKLPHILGFLVPFTGLFSIIEKLNPFKTISWFFLFIMLIEPKTSGYGTLRGFVFGTIAGVSSFLIFKFLPAKDFFVFSLFIANLFNPIFDKLFYKINDTK